MISISVPVAIIIVTGLTCVVFISATYITTKFSLKMIRDATNKMVRPPSINVWPHEKPQKIRRSLHIPEEDDATVR
jgi:hypothetical protein